MENIMNLKDYEYYCTELGVLYHGDCLEILPLIGKVDLVLTDPPYGIEYKSNHYKNGNPFEKIVGDKHYPIEMVSETMKITNKACFFFCRWDNLIQMPVPKSFIVWHKNNWSAGDLKHEYGRMWEGIAFWPQESHEFNNRLPDVLDCPRISANKLKHPTEKPVDLLVRLIGANKGDLILDPFCGSGTTCVAAKMLGRNYIGIDISEEYCQIARDRIKAVETGVPVKEQRKGQRGLFEK